MSHNHKLKSEDSWKINRERRTKMSSGSSYPEDEHVPINDEWEQFEQAKMEYMLEFEKQQKIKERDYDHKFRKGWLK